MCLNLFIKLQNYYNSLIARALVIVLLCLASFIPAYAQNKVSGTVTDENSEPLIGATVMVVGESTGTATDIDGNFAINAKQGATLRVSYVGYVTA
ncbi:MAG: carboxypeptidase-like regulatory domain-containing protein, partial [Muribaculaceae bacterium]|nr:carboxypeptidase-like regulatory domain-containing protein [Muribaculaceae bacterium]